jgi:hypothetical protein
MDANKPISILILAAALAAGGCVTCGQHPVACAVGAALVAGTAVELAAAHGHRDAHAPGHVTVGTPNCAATPAICQ